MDVATGTGRAARAAREDAPRWSERLPIAAAAACGLAVACDLALVQLGVVGRAWDPVFGSASSGRVLASALSRALPIPDAAVGALGYALELELVLALAGGPDPTRAGRWTAIAYGIVAGLLGGAAIVLVAWQAAVLRSGCALCLLSAAISSAIALASWREIRGAASALRHRWPFEHEHA